MELIAKSAPLSQFKILMEHQASLVLHPASNVLHHQLKSLYLNKNNLLYKIDHFILANNKRLSLQSLKIRLKLYL